MFSIFTNLGAFFGLLVAIFKDYLKVNKMWPRKHEQVVADSISMTALLIGIFTSLPYLLLVMFVYNDWLVTARTLSDIVRAFLTILIAIGYWVHLNRNIPIWTLFLRTLNIGKLKPQYEIVLVPQDDIQLAKVMAQYPNMPLESRRGGHVFVAENCNSFKNAEASISKYQDLGVYVTYVEVVL